MSPAGEEVMFQEVVPLAGLAARKSFRADGITKMYSLLPLLSVRAENSTTPWFKYLTIGYSTINDRDSSYQFSRLSILSELEPIVHVQQKNRSLWLN